MMYVKSSKQKQEKDGYIRASILLSKIERKYHERLTRLAKDLTVKKRNEFVQTFGNYMQELTDASNKCFVIGQKEYKRFNKTQYQVANGMGKVFEYMDAKQDDKNSKYMKVVYQWVKMSVYMALLRRSSK